MTDCRAGPVCDGSAGKRLLDHPFKSFYDMITAFLRSGSPEETESYGKALGGMLAPGDFVLLSGDLGAGKTAFTRGICENFDLKTPVTSPSFSLINVYESGKGVSVVHCDAYRLSGAEDLYEIGLFDYDENDTIFIIEWADAVFDVKDRNAVKLPGRCFRVDIKRRDDISETRRDIEITGPDERIGSFESIVS